MKTDSLFWREVVPFIGGCVLAGLVVWLLSSEPYHRWRFVLNCSAEHDRPVCEQMWATAQEGY